MRKSYLIAIIVLVIALLWMAPALLSNKNKDNLIEKTSSNREVNIMRVETLTVNAEPMLERVEVNGQTKASRVVELRARTIGRFANILLERGAVVDKGQLIAQMDIDDRKARLDKAKAILRQRTTEYDVAKGLEDRGFNSKVKLETARANLKIAKADLKQAELDLSYTKIKAPFAGILEEQDIEIGTYVREGDIIATMVDLDPLDVRVFVAERHINQIGLGVKAEITLSNKEKSMGVVNYIAKVANSDTRTFRVDVRIDNPNYKISSGLTAKVAFLLPEHIAHHIPLSALVLNDKGVVGVKIVEKQEAKNSWVAKFIPVSLLQEDTKSVWVDGLKDDVQLITIGQDFVMDGKPVIAINKDIANAENN